jgi:hypothetical protein
MIQAARVLFYAGVPVALIGAVGFAFLAVMAAALCSLGHCASE